MDDEIIKIITTQSYYAEPNTDELDLDKDNLENINNIENILNYVDENFSEYELD